MKLISFTRLGRTGFGAMVKGGVVDLTSVISQDVTSLRGLLATPGGLEAARNSLEGRSADFALSDVTLLPVVPDPGKILCVGLNYETHRAETKRPEAQHPTMFTRYADSQVAHGQAMIKPAVSEKLDFEGEVAVIIGKGGRYIDEADAMSHVAGYACYNDGTARDWQRHTHQFTPGKTFPGTGAFGPWMLTADEVADYSTLAIETRLNGEVMQKATLADLIFPVERLIAYISSFTPLAPGDVILSGTPGGVGDRREPPLYMKAGDLVEIDIGPLGCLSNVVADEKLDM
jgi:2-keto-4-pentenoate hydratase/2-oxohepta-3-ene-1,7-dioic acid hydratase in catechol pathway